MSKRVTKAAPAKKQGAQFDLFNQLLLVVLAATVTTFPFIFDSFTVSKLFVLSVGLTYISIKLFLNKDAAAVRTLPRSLLVLVALFALSMIASWSQSGVPILRGLFGQFGRGNGLFYYFFVILIFVYTVKTFKSSSARKTHQLITMLSWFMAVYAGLQRVGIDVAKLDTRGISPVVLTFGNSNFAGGMLSVLFAYHLTYSVVSKTYRAKQLGLLFALIASSTFAAAVQGYLIILFSIALAFSILITQRVRKPWITKLIISGWVLGIITTILGVFGKFIFASVFARASFQARIEYWRISLDVIRDYPFFGVGPDKLYDVTSNYMSPGSLKMITTTRMDNAHNWFLNLGANFGLLSLLFLLLILGFAFFYTAKHFKKFQETSVVGISAAVAFISIFIDGFVSIEQPGMGVWLYLFAGITIASGRDLVGIEAKVNSAHLKKDLKANKLQKTIASCLMISLLLSNVILIQRVYFDAVLRSNVQTAFLNKGTIETFSKIERAAVYLKAEPEYSIQVLGSLAAIGDALKIDTVSIATYEYYHKSIQATLVRADVLRALNRENESCPMRSTLIANMPWDSIQLDKYITCVLDNFFDPNKITNLKRASKYFTEQSRTLNPLSTTVLPEEISRANLVANQARTYFILNQVKIARSLQSLAETLLQRLVEFEASNPNSIPKVQLEHFHKVVDF